LNRTIPLLLGAAIALVLAAPAHATLTYVKNPRDGKPSRVWVADDDGKHPHRLGKGRAPVVSPDGRLVAHDYYDDRQGWHTAVLPAAGGEPPRVASCETVVSRRENAP
jgi:hypothetical protein